MKAEIFRLRELEEEFSWERYSNVKIKEHMLDKSLKQISEKQKETRIGRRRDLEEKIQEIPEIEEDRAEGNFEENQIKKRWKLSLTEAINERELGDWRAHILKCALGLKVLESSTLGGLYESADALLRFVQREPTVTTETDKFIENTLVLQFLQGEERKEKSSQEEKKEKEENQRTNAGYLQELPEKIGRNGDQRCSRIGENSHQGRLLAGSMQLWGIKGPKVHLPTGNVPPTDLLTTFSEITASDISRRISHIKKDSAHGPDKIKKCRTTNFAQLGTISFFFANYKIMVLTSHIPA